MFFWGPLTGPGVLRKMGLLRYEIMRVCSLRNHLSYIFLTDLDPDGWLAADQLKLHAMHLKNRVQTNKRSCFRPGQ